MCSELLYHCGYTTSVLKEEDDNRLVIKAQFVNPSEYIGHVELQKYLNHLENTAVLFKVIRQISISIDDIKSEKHNLEHLYLSSQDQLSSTLSQLATTQDQLSVILNSNSWKITKPLRFIIGMLRKSNQ